MALQGQQQLLGLDHPDCLITQASIGNELGRLGRLGEAEARQRYVLEQREMKLGKEHAHTLCSMNNLAIVLSDRGKHQEALEMHQVVWDARRNCVQMGDNHVHTIASLDNLAVVLMRMGRVQDATCKHRIALRRRTRLREKGVDERDAQTLYSGKGSGSWLSQ